jgi:CRP-like cAMP-binding protein
VVLGAGGKSGPDMQRHTPAGLGEPVGQRLNALGLTASADLEAFWKLVKVREKVDRGETIAGTTDMAKRFTVLLEGVACFSTHHEDGTRQIHAFHYRGDFPGLHSFMFPQPGEPGEVQALTGCCIGTIDSAELERAMVRRPALGRALWRAALTEASIFRQRLVISRRSALQRVAHLLCEQLARLGVTKGGIPLTQIDVADAAGLSVVHINRVFQDLRQLGVLSKQRLIEVIDRDHLQKLAAFDAGYLDMSESLCRWDLRIEE